LHASGGNPERQGGRERNGWFLPSSSAKKKGGGSGRRRNGRPVPSEVETKASPLRLLHPIVQVEKMYSTMTPVWEMLLTFFKQPLKHNTAESERGSHTRACISNFASHDALSL